MIEHIVLVKFSEATTEEQLQDVCGRFRALHGRIPGLLEAQAGITFSTNNQGYQVLLTARFEDRAALEAYSPHPEHKAVSAYIREVGREDSIVMDIEI